MRPIAANVARIAGRQRGRVTAQQLIEAGLDRNRIKRWVADGRLRREHKGVYTLGHPDSSPAGQYTSAVLAAGNGAFLSHEPAAYLLRIVRRPPPAPEVTIASGHGRRRPGIRIHRSSLPALDVAQLECIPITIAPRVLLDLAPRLPAEELARACHEAWVHHRVTPRQVEACIARNPHKPAIAHLRLALGSDVTLSALESGFLALLDGQGLPRPRTNVDRRGDKVDCHWPALDLTVELMSYRHHATRHAFETDLARRRRSSHLAYSYGDIFERGPLTIAELEPLLTS